MVFGESQISFRELIFNAISSEKSRLILMLVLLIYIDVRTLKFFSPARQSSKELLKVVYLQVPEVS